METRVENEKQLFERWIQIEKNEWESLNNSPYKELENGIACDEMSSIWCSSLYKTMQGSLQEELPLFAYIFQLYEDKNYFLDFEKDDLHFRISFSIAGDSVIADLFFKEKDGIRYLNFLEYAPSEEFWVDQDKTAKEHMIFLLFVYEKVKEFILNETSYRLLFVTGKLEIDESSVEEIKNSYDLE